MKLPRQLSKRQLVKIVETIRDWLYMDQDDLDTIKDEYGNAFATKLTKHADEHKNTTVLFDYLNPNKTWDPDITDGVMEVLTNAGLVPTYPMTPREAYRKPTPNENWKDDSIQFPRLLDALPDAGAIYLMGEAEWRALEQDMGLPHEKIMEIFTRAEEECDRIKKEQGV